MKQGLCARYFVSALLSLALAACSGSDGKDGKACTVIHDSTGVGVLSCPDGTKTVVETADGGAASSCSVVAPDGGARKIVCDDGTEVVLPSPGTTPCVVVSNSDGTSRVTCPGADGGLISIIVKNALVNFANLGVTEKADLALTLTVGDVSFPTDGRPVVSFRASDREGNAIIGLPPADMRFALLKLVPGTKGGNDTWVSYIAANATSTASTETAAAAATATNGLLTDNGDGSYAYTFAHNVLDPTKAGTTFDAAAVHRLAILVSESGNPFAPLNVVRDFIPATGADVTGKNDKVDGAACLECHSSFRAKAGGTGAFHGGTRYDVRVCVACHNDQRRFTDIPGTGTPPAAAVDVATMAASGASTWTGNAVTVNGQAFIDLPVFIHKIHMGDGLTLKGGTYTAIAKPYEIAYPQDVRNCTKCHRAANPADPVAVAQAKTFMTKPTMKACGSCHDGTSFLATAPAAVSHNKGNDQADDSACATCHTAQGTKKSVLETHMPVADPDPTATWLGGTNASTNAAYLPAAGVPTPGATRIAYDVKSITRDLNKNPSIVFRFTKYTITPKDGIPIVFNTYIPGVTTELMDGFANSPSVYFAFAVPQDGLAAPADFNATASGYIKGIWNGSATGAGAGTMIFDPATGYYTITLIGVTIPDTATMLTGGVGYTYSLSTTPPMVQTDLPAYPYGDSTTIPNCIAGKMCGGLIVTAQDVAVVATDTATGKAYSARRPIVDTANCLKCHEQLGANPTFHAGQRNDGATCAFCHKPNQTSGGWSASSSTFIHGIHGASIRNTGFSWHAACPTGTTFADGTCTAANADPYFANVSYPGVLNNCLQCHKPGTFDFSATTSAAALPNLLMSTVGTGTYAADISTSRYVTLGQDYGTNFSTANLTSGTKDGVACTTAAPCPCTLTSPCNASGTTLVESPITAACSACHDAPIAINHMKEMGGTFYGTRTEALARTESCMLCHGPGTIAAIAAVHK